MRLGGNRYWVPLTYTMSVTTEFSFMCFQTGKKDEEQGKD